MAFSEYLKKKRVAAGISQQRLADLITARGHNVTAGSISNIERAYYKKQDGSESQPDKQFVIKAAEVLALDVDEALIAADYAPLKNMPPKPQNLTELIDALSSLGVDGINFFDEDKLRDAPPEEIERVYDSIRLAVELTLNKYRPNGSPHNRPNPLHR